METNIMISSRLNWRGFCYAAILAVMSTLRKDSLFRLPLPELKLDDRVRTERICEDHISPNYYGGLDWECGFVVGYVWQYDGWLPEHYRRGWTYWVLFDKSNSEIDGDRQWLNFIRHTEVVRE